MPNLLVADGSVCPTQGSANPALTIVAARLAERIVHRATSKPMPRRAGDHAAAVCHPFPIRRQHCDPNYVAGRLTMVNWQTSV